MKLAIPACLNPNNGGLLQGIGLGTPVDIAILGKRPENVRQCWRLGRHPS